MRIYFSGIGGVGLGPLAEIANDAGYTVLGSDTSSSLMTTQLQDRGVTVSLDQTGSFLEQSHLEQPIDWLVYTSALPPDHPELLVAQRLGIKTSKRDQLLAEIIKSKNQKLIAVAGTHGKTTTSGMLVWSFKQLGIPISYSVGSTLGFGPSGQYDNSSQYFVYECDEFDRNFLHFFPELSLIASLDYDHADTYPSPDEYRHAFIRFIEQSNQALMWDRDLRYLKTDPAANIEAFDHLMNLDHITLPGTHNRQNAYLVQRALSRLTGEDGTKIQQAINSFPGTSRRMEKLVDNLYSDYGHHPAEIAATLQLARELSDSVVLVYQPHQNIRQHEIKSQYKDQFEGAEKTYWLPTYLSREDPSLPILTPAELTADLTNRESIEFADLNDELWQNIQAARDSGKLVIAMGAGSIDSWLRDQLSD